MIPPEAVAAHLPRQRWFGAKDRAIEAVELVDETVLRDGFPRLVRLLARVSLAGGAAPVYQLLVGARPAGEPTEFLQGSEHASFGELETADGPVVAYDATFDHELGLALLEVVAPGERANLVRLVGAEQSNTSLVYDDRLILKVFRQLEEGPNPDVEVTMALAEQGFTHVAAPVAHQRLDGRDLAVVQRFLAGSAEGWSLALTSLRDLFGVLDTRQMPVIGTEASAAAEPPRPSEMGGDFAAEARRLGAVTAELHVALAAAFGRDGGDVTAWAGPMDAQLARTGHPDLDVAAVRALLDRLRSVRDPGPAIRIHGDYHLGQVLRTDTGWYVLDFEGEPARPLAERRAPTSPLKDVAGMLRSFHYAAQVAVRERSDPDHAGELDAMADAWELRNRTAFVDGYMKVAREAGVLPPRDEDIEVVLAAFELDKAVYELAYESAHRPDWVGIPLSGIRRILEAP